MESVSTAVQQFFKDEQWGWARGSQPQVMNTSFQGNNANFNCVAVCIDDKDQFLWYTVAPVACPAPLRQVMAEFITRANWGLHVGNFEMDWRDGEIRFRTSVDVEKTGMTPRLAGNLIYMGAMTMDRYIPGILGIIHGSLSAEEAITKVEG